MTSDYITLADAASFLPRKNGKKPHVRTLERWIRQGCRVRRDSSLRIRLTAKKIGWQWYTTREWMRDFEDACSVAAIDTGLDRTPQERRKAHDYAKRELIRRFGFRDSSGTLE